ncbi:MAG: hypothetical protein CMM46_11450 [Rhodospirillaceae bacterium]|nr:hypothetical protein [Rhodospirillaceae bacterium]|tara:strand:+ start:10213 stop:10539 length:327 start_codon:yes stop_codon:yes gene_type:complete
MALSGPHRYFSLAAAFFRRTHTRRANSVDVLERSGAKVIQRIAEAELDSCLEAQGYERHDPTLTMIGAIPRRIAGHTDVRLSTTLTPAWFDGFCRHSPVAQHHRESRQ